VIADGAGSASQAEDASRIAVDAVLDWCPVPFLESWPLLSQMEQERQVRQAFEWAHLLIEDAARRSGNRLADYHTTLATAVITDSTVTLASIGDAALSVRTIEGEWRTVIRPENGQYVNETWFVTQRDALDHHFHCSLVTDAVDAVVLTTDGLHDLAYSDPYADCVPYPAFFDPLIARLHSSTDIKSFTKKLRAFLASERIRNRVSDDLTLALWATPTERGEG
jgi:serine/threonine protein phosphatase PrpC